MKRINYFDSVSDEWLSLCNEWDHDLTTLYCRGWRFVITESNRWNSIDPYGKKRTRFHSLMDAAKELDSQVQPEFAAPVSIIPGG